MIASRAKGIAKLGVTCQCLVLTLCFWLWLWASQARVGVWSLELRRYVLYNIVLVAGIVFVYATTTSGIWFTQLAFYICHRHALRQTVFCAGSLLLLLVGEQDHTISRIFLFSMMPIMYALFFATHRLLPPVLRRLSFGSIRVQRMLVAGGCQNIAAALGWLASKERVGFTITGMICHDRPPGTFQGLKIWGTLEDLERVIKEQDITHVILLEIPAFRQFLSYYTEVCERHGVRLQVLCDFERSLRRPVTLFEDEGLRFIGLREEPLEDPFGRLAKRCLDIVVALPVVLFILPFTTLLVAWLQRRYSPGPIFYRQLRSGLQNVPFAILKYRTMHVSNPDPARQAAAGDERIYFAGGWLRKFSIDELPQFLNVLFGDMSVVGPRPHLLDHDEQFAQAMANYFVRGTVKPGITGLAQVRGLRGETRTTLDVVRRVESDIQYLENWSFGMDCWIIARTAMQVVSPPQTAV